LKGVFKNEDGRGKNGGGSKRKEREKQNRGGGKTREGWGVMTKKSVRQGRRKDGNPWLLKMGAIGRKKTRE